MRSRNRSATTGFSQYFTAELGEELADSLRRVRRFQETMALRRSPDEGLRERKQRLTRQRISDVATILFASRGFDNVKVSTIADVVGVSEKTVYNYFPTKESMVLDWADETIESLAQVIPGLPVERVAHHRRGGRDEENEEDMERFDEVPDDLAHLPAQVHRADRARRRPACRAAWLEMNDRIITVAAEGSARCRRRGRPARSRAADRGPGVERGWAGYALRARGALHRGRATRAGSPARRRARRSSTALRGCWRPGPVVLQPADRRSGALKQQVLEAAQAADEARAQVAQGFAPGPHGLAPDSGPVRARRFASSRPRGAAPERATGTLAGVRGQRSEHGRGGRRLMGRRSAVAAAPAMPVAARSPRAWGRPPRPYPRRRRHQARPRSAARSSRAPAACPPKQAGGLLVTAFLHPLVAGPASR